MTGQVANGHSSDVTTTMKPSVTQLWSELDCELQRITSQRVKGQRLSEDFVVDRVFDAIEKLRAKQMKQTTNAPLIPLASQHEDIADDPQMRLQSGKFEEAKMLVEKAETRRAILEEELTAERSQYLEKQRCHAVKEATMRTQPNKDKLMTRIEDPTLPETLLEAWGKPIEQLEAERDAANNEANKAETEFHRLSNEWMSAEMDLSNTVVDVTLRSRSPELGGTVAPGSPGCSSMPQTLTRSTMDIATMQRVSNKVSNTAHDVVHQSKDGGNQHIQVVDKLFATVQSIPQQYLPFMPPNPQVTYFPKIPAPPPVTTISQPIASSMLTRQSQGQCPPLHGYEAEMLGSARGYVFPLGFAGNSFGHYSTGLLYPSPRLLPPVRTARPTRSQPLSNELSMTPVTRYPSLPIAQASNATPLLATVRNMSQLPTGMHRATIGAPNLQGARGNPNVISFSSLQQSLVASPNGIQNGLDASVMAIRPTGIGASLPGSQRVPPAATPAYLPSRQSLDLPHSGSAHLVSSKFVRQSPTLREPSPTSRTKLAPKESKNSVCWSSSAIETCCCP